MTVWFWHVIFRASLARLIPASASFILRKSRHCSVKQFCKPGLKWTRSQEKPVFLASLALASPVKPFWMSRAKGGLSLWPDYHPQQWTVLNRHRGEKCNRNLARLPNQVQIQIQSTVLPGLQLSFTYILCDSYMIIRTIMSFLSLASDRKSLDFYRNPLA